MYAEDGEEEEEEEDEEEEAINGGFRRCPECNKNGTVSKVPGLLLKSCFKIRAGGLMNSSDLFLPASAFRTIIFFCFLLN